jgi:transcriptional regulator with XRE-family HTH domain
MNLKELRKAKRLTCQALADACCVSIYTMRAYESGKRQMSVDTLHNMAKALGTTMDEVYQAYTQHKGGGRI